MANKGLKKYLRRRYKDRVRYSKLHNKRFYSSYDMAEIKRDEAIRNSKIKRGEIQNNVNEVISVCSCGARGCFFSSGWKTYPKEYFNKWSINRDKNKYQR